MAGRSICLPRVSVCRREVAQVPLLGATSMEPPSAPVSPHADSTTVFVGQCFVDRRGKEVLETAWLLREGVPSRRDVWKATR